MTNEERRRALNKARAKALHHAEISERYEAPISEGPGYWHRMQALMWAAVAEAVKDGDPVHDAPDGRPAMAFDQPTNTVLNTEYGTITR